MNEHPPNNQPVAAFAELLDWNEPALAAAAAKVAQACHDWRREWAGAGVTGTPGRATPSAASFVSTRAGHALIAYPLHQEEGGGEPAVRAWLGLPAQAADDAVSQAAELVGRQIFGEAVTCDPGNIAAELSQAALDHLAGGLRGMLGIRASAAPFDLRSLAAGIPEAEFCEWSGGVRVELQGFGDLALYLNGRAVAGIVPPAEPPLAAPKPLLTPVSIAAQHRLVDLKAVLHGVEFTLGHLKSLQVGDVVVLPHRLDAPLQVVTGPGTAICHAYLGSAGDHRALEVVAPAVAGGAS